MRTDKMAGGFGFPIGCVGVVAAVIAADLAGATGQPWVSLVAVGFVVVAMASRTTVPAAAGVAVVGLGLHSGFVLGRAGRLVFDGPAAQAAVVLGVVLVFGLLGSAALRYQRPVSIPAPRRPTTAPARRAANAAMMRGRPAG